MTTDHLLGTHVHDLYRLVYSSVATVKLSEHELETLLGTSRTHNEFDGITGILLHVDAGPDQPAYYVQLLEGPRAAVDDAYERIARDDLHQRVQVLSTGPAQRRQFRGWTMRREELDEADFVRLARQGPAPANALERLVRDPWAVERALGHYVTADLRDPAPAGRSRPLR